MSQSAQEYNSKPAEGQIENLKFKVESAKLWNRLRRWDLMNPAIQDGRAKQPPVKPVAKYNRVG
ncbi:MAG TPA: hypothetical protein DD726_06310 [Phycisphaerales bacterium]|nr:hypothetical protein [Phycisphaerales bacterium]